MDVMSALAANYLSRGPKAGELPGDARPVLLRLGLAALALAVVLMLL